MTERWCEAAAPNGAARAEYFDSLAAGLVLRCSPGHKSWSFVFTAPSNGKRARVALGTYPAISLAAARARALEARGYVDGGEDPRVVFAATAGGAMTVADMVESYLEKHAATLRTCNAITRRMHRNVLPVIGTAKLAELHRRDVNRVVDPILKRGKLVEAARVFEDLRAALRWALARGDLDRNPADGMKKPGAVRSRERVLNDDEIRTLWNGLPAALTKSRNCQRIIKLCLVTGQRVGEVAGMRRDELDEAARMWLLPGERTKNKYPHNVPLSDLALGVISEALADAGEGPFVFSSGNGALPGQAVAHTIAIATKEGRFGVAGWSAHDLRRTALTGMAALGVAPIVLGHVANHRTTTRAGVTLAVYSRYTYDAEKRAALTLWAERLEAIVGGRDVAKLVKLHA
jgi:integrase